jgi:hypothetical protein
MKKENSVLCGWILAYGLAYAFFHIMPAFLSGFLTGPITQGDALDFLTPFVVIPIAIMLYSQIKKVSGAKEYAAARFQKLSSIILILGFIFYADGHGLHLSANSIARLVEGQQGSTLYNAVYLFDEIISHFMWDGGVVLISLGLIFLARNRDFGLLSSAQVSLIAAGSVFYGFSFAANGVEGQTVVFTFPAAAAVFFLTLWFYLKDQKRKNQNPILLFFLCGYFLSAVLFAYWGITHPGFPEFSELGWI